MEDLGTVIFAATRGKIGFETMEGLLLASSDQIIHFSLRGNGKITDTGDKPI